MAPERSSALAVAVSIGALIFLCVCFRLTHRLPDLHEKATLPSIFANRRLQLRSKEHALPTFNATGPDLKYTPVERETSPTLAGASTDASKVFDAAVLVFCYNRANLLNQTLESLSRLPGLRKFAVYISQDGEDADVHNVATAYRNGPLAPPATRGVQHWQKERMPTLSAEQPGHAWLSQHYKWGLDRAFLEGGHSHVIIVEDDMLFSPDFLHYFEVTASLLDLDPSLWCISSWNDNGNQRLDWDPRRLFRTSYFPGLGWMMRRALWEELGPAFPRQAWDHWMRLESIARGRECVVPEVNRNRNVGEVGANMDARVYRRYLATMAWERAGVHDFGDLGYLLQPRYTADMRALLGRAHDLPSSLLRATLRPGQVYLALYRSERYASLVRPLGIWPFPRGHHRHVARLPWRNATLLLADQRFCPLLLPARRLLPTPGLRALPAPRATSCDATCRAQGLLCRDRDFWYINSCERLREHFACEAGCAMELGPDVPCYVEDAAVATHRACLVTQKQPRCYAQHPATRRLCPCA